MKYVVLRGADAGEYGIGGVEVAFFVEWWNEPRAELA